MEAPTHRRPPLAANRKAERDGARATPRFSFEPSTVATVLGLLAVLAAGSQSCSGAASGHAALERSLVSAH